MTAGYQPYPSFDADPLWDAEHPISVYGKIFSKKVCDWTHNQFSHAAHNKII